MEVIKDEWGWWKKHWLNYKHLPFSISNLLWNTDTKDNNFHFQSVLRDSDGKLKKLTLASYTKNDGYTHREHKGFGR